MSAKKIIGIVLIVICVILVLHPGFTAGLALWAIVKFGEVFVYYTLANLSCKLLFGKSLRKWLTEED